MTESAKAPPTDRLPWPLAGAALAALAAQAWTYWAEPYGGAAPVQVFVTLLLASYLTRWRLPRRAWVEWLVRAVAFGSVVLVYGVPRETLQQWYMKPEYTLPAGYCVAAEFLLRAWRRVPPGKVAATRGVQLFLTALLFLAATNTYQRFHIQVLAPVYLLFAALSLRTFDPAPAAGGRPARPRGLLALRAVAVLAALFFGFSGVFAVTKYDYRITNWTFQLLQPKSPRRHTEIGLTRSPRLSAIFNPEPSTARVLVIDGQPSERHLRMMVFDRYEHRIWGPKPAERVFGQFDDRRLAAGATGPRIRVCRLVDTYDLLPLPLEAAGVVSATPVDGDDQGVLRNEGAGSEPPYEVILPTTADFQGPLCQAPADDLRDRMLVVPPEVSWRVPVLAKAVAGTGNPLSRVRKIEAYLRSHNAYSLNFEPQGEPLSDFILNHRAAHCQYFASALVVMARAAGVPARLVTGYYAHERYDDHTSVVRERDAHAWAECWVDGVGWVTADATPSDGRPDALFTDPPKWQRRWERIQDIPRRLRDWVLTLPLPQIGRVMLIVAAIAGAGWLARKVPARLKVNRRNRQAAYIGAGPELAAAARRFERLLRKRGVPLAPDRTWRESLQSLADDPARIDPDTYLRFVAAYENARFGGDRHSVQNVTELLDGLGPRKRKQS